MRKKKGTKKLVISFLLSTKPTFSLSIKHNIKSLKTTNNNNNNWKSEHRKACGLVITHAL